VEACIEALKQLAQTSDALFGLEGPSFSPLAESLEAVLSRLRSITRELGIGSTLKTGAESISEMQDDVDLSHSVQFGIAGGIKNRTHALTLLREIASFFRTSEPHSPVAYLADKAARWGEMPLHSWLRSVLKDSSTLSNIEEMLGLNMEGSDASN
jgi:type VI secretion system protein ImpA